MIPFPLPIRQPRNEIERLYAMAYLKCMTAAWQLACDPARGWQGTIMTPAQSFAAELIEGAEVYLNLRAEKIATAAVS